MRGSKVDGGGGSGHLSFLFLLFVVHGHRRLLVGRSVRPPPLARLPACLLAPIVCARMVFRARRPLKADGPIWWVHAVSETNTTTTFTTTTFNHTEKKKERDLFVSSYRGEQTKDNVKYEVRVRSRKRNKVTSAAATTHSHTKAEPMK